VCHVHAAPKDCLLLDEDAWKAANPAMGVFRSLEDVREQAESVDRLREMRARMDRAEKELRERELRHKRRRVRKLLKMAKARELKGQK